MTETASTLLLPLLAASRSTTSSPPPAGLQITAAPRADHAACHTCGHQAIRAHSHYERRLADTAIVGGRSVVLRLRVRRFFCDDPDRPVATFAEQLAGLTVPHARRTVTLQRVLVAIALALAGRAG